MNTIFRDDFGPEIFRVSKNEEAGYMYGNWPFNDYPLNSRRTLCYGILISPSGQMWTGSVTNIPKGLHAEQLFFKKVGKSPIFNQLKHTLEHNPFKEKAKLWLLINRSPCCLHSPQYTDYVSQCIEGGIHLAGCSGNILDFGRENGHWLKLFPKYAGFYKSGYESYSVCLPREAYREIVYKNSAISGSFYQKELGRRLNPILNNSYIESGSSYDEKSGKPIFSYTFSGNLQSPAVNFSNPDLKDSSSGWSLK